MWEFGACLYFPLYSEIAFHIACDVTNVAKVELSYTGGAPTIVTAAHILHAVPTHIFSTGNRLACFIQAVRESRRSRDVSC